MHTSTRAIVTRSIVDQVYQFVSFRRCFSEVSYAFSFRSLLPQFVSFQRCFSKDSFAFSFCSLLPLHMVTSSTIWKTVMGMMFILMKSRPLLVTFTNTISSVSRVMISFRHRLYFLFPSLFRSFVSKVDLQTSSMSLNAVSVIICNYCVFILRVNLGCYLWECAYSHHTLL